jgi:hypothetical protein
MGNSTVTPLASVYHWGNPLPGGATVLNGPTAERPAKAAGARAIINNTVNRILLVLLIT